MATSTASRYINAQYVAYVSGSDGPHKDITYPFSIAYWIRWDANPSNLSDYPMGICNTTSLNPYLGSRQGTIDNKMYGRRSVSGASDTSSVACVGQQWFYCVQRMVAADSSYFHVGDNSSDQDTTSKDIVGQVGNMDCSTAGGLNNSTAYTANNSCMACPIIINKDLTSTIRGELMYNPFSFVDGLLWAPDFLNTSNVIADFKDLSGNGYHPTNGVSPTTSQHGPPIFLLGGQ